MRCVILHIFVSQWCSGEGISSVELFARHMLDVIAESVLTQMKSEVSRG